MSRPIEFRAYHKVLKKMLPVHKLSFGNPCLVYSMDGVEEIINTSNDCLLLQFTGLTDKNGVKIFEGDIVKLFDSYNGVMSKDGAPVFFNQGYVGGWVIGDNKSYVSLGARKPSEVEVIGNIYQDKHLQENE